MAHFTSSVRNVAWRLELPSPQLVSRWKSHFPIRWWCNVLSLLISQGPSTVEEGSADMLTASLLETIISAGSIVRPTSTAGRVHCLYKGLGGGGLCGQLHQGKSEQQHTQPRWMIACCVRHSAPHSYWDAVSEEDQWVDAVLKWRLQLQAPYWWRTSLAVRYFVFWLTNPPWDEQRSAADAACIKSS